MLLGSFTHTGLLNAGSSYSQSQAVALPQYLVGSYNLFVKTDADQTVYETTYSNDTSAAMPISIVLQLPDLVVSAASAPATATSGSAVLVKWTVSNQGSGGTGTTSWQDNVYADTGTTVDANAVALGSFTNTAALAAGGSYSQSQLVALPIGFSGNYNLLVVTDEPAGTNTTHPVTESNYNDDTSAPIPITVNRQLPDLVVTSVTAPATAVTGGTASITWSVKNTGDAATNVNAWEDAIWASTHSTLASGGTDVLVTSVLHSNCAGRGGRLHRLR